MIDNRKNKLRITVPRRACLKGACLRNGSGASKRAASLSGSHHKGSQHILLRDEAGFNRVQAGPRPPARTADPLALIDIVARVQARTPAVSLPAGMRPAVITPVGPG